MLKYLRGMTIAVAAFCVGVVGNSLINGFGLFLVDRYQPVRNLASATVAWGERTINGPRNDDNIRCYLVVTVSDDGTLYLNHEETGTLANPSELLDRLRSIFEARTQRRVYKAGIEATSDVPEGDRIEKTVYLRVARQIRFGEVTDLIEKLKVVGASQIGLVSEASVE